MELAAMQTVYSLAFLELTLKCELFRRLCVCEVATAMLQGWNIVLCDSKACVPWSPKFWVRAEVFMITKASLDNLVYPHCWRVIPVLHGASYESWFDILQFWGLMGASFSPSLYHRMRGLLFQYRFSCVVIRFFFLCVCILCMRKQKRKREGI